MARKVGRNRCLKISVAWVLSLTVALTPLAMSILNSTTTLAAKAKKKAILVNVDGKLLTPAKKAGYAVGKKYLINGKKAAKAMKAKYKYVKRKKTITVKKGKVTLKFKLGKKKYTVSGKKKKSNIAPKKYKKIIYLPAKAMAKKLGYGKIAYLKSEKMLFINKSNKKKVTPLPSTGVNTAVPTTTPTTVPTSPVVPTTTPAATTVTPISTLTATQPVTVKPTTVPTVTKAPMKPTETAPVGLPTIGLETTPSVEQTSEPTVSSSPTQSSIIEYKVYGNDFEEDTTFFSERYINENGISETAVQPGANNTNQGIEFGGNWSTLIFHSGMSLMVDQEYVASFYAKGGLYKVYITGDMSTTPDIHVRQGIGPEDWTYYEVRFTAGTDVTGAFSFKIQTGSEPCLLDEFKLVRIYDTSGDSEVVNPLPRMEINAPEAYKILGLADKSVKVDAEISINDGTKARTELLEPTMANLSGRGNSTFASDFLDVYPKRPMKFTFKNKVAKSILGMPAGRKWNLMAEMYDRTLMRNYLAQNFARNLPGLEWQPSCKHIELYVNGEYYGVYLLTEAINDESERLNIDTDNGNEPGFLVEWDSRAVEEAAGDYADMTDAEKAEFSVEDLYFNISMYTRDEGWKNQSFAFKEPEADDMNDAQREYIRKSVQDMSTAISNLDNWEQYMDIDSFVDFYMVNDIFVNYDAASFTSVYLYKRPGEKIKMGPCWDYDIYIGNDNTDYSSKWIEWAASPWVYRLIKNSSTFRTEFIDHWYNTNRAIFETKMIDEIDVIYDEIKDAAKRNFERWPVLNEKMFGSESRGDTFTYDGEVDYLRQWLKNRKSFLDGFYSQTYGY